jgi:chromosome partitioning protein
MKTVAFFNHKGGVGKTTLLFNVGVVLGEMKKRVILIDGDAQSNLTALALSEKNYQACTSDDHTIWSAVSPLVSGAGDIKKIPPRQIRDNVWLLPGDIRVSNFEEICPVGWTEALAGQARGFRVTSAMYRVALGLRDVVKAEIALIDLGPNVNALNRSVLIAVDGFVVPLAPDLFSVMALPSVGTSLKRWVTEWRTALEHKPEDLKLALPGGLPRPLGYLSQQFSTYRKSPSSAFKQWMNRIPGAYQDGVIAPLKKIDIEPPKGDFSLGSLKNYGALIPTAQDGNKALFELSGRQALGSQDTKAQASRTMFVKVATEILNRLGV